MKTRKPYTSLVYTAIERDKRGYWHPVIEVRERGTLVWSVVSVDGVNSAVQAQRAAALEARRIVRQSD